MAELTSSQFQMLLLRLEQAQKRVANAQMKP